MKVDFDIQGMAVHFDNLFNGNKVLGECPPRANASNTPEANTGHTYIHTYIHGVQIQNTLRSEAHFWGTKSVKPVFFKLWSVYHRWPPGGFGRKALKNCIRHRRNENTPIHDCSRTAFVG
jgi:hypothetical protein